MKSLLPLLACALLWTVAPSRVHAQAAAPTAEQRARAREAYTRGQQLFDAGQFEPAQAAFEEAYVHVPNPIVLLGVASAQEARGLRSEARVTLERYLRESPNARDRASIEARIAALPLPASGSSVAGTAPSTTPPPSATPPSATPPSATPPSAATAPSATPPPSAGAAPSAPNTGASPGTAAPSTTTTPSTSGTPAADTPASEASGLESAPPTGLEESDSAEAEAVDAGETDTAPPAPTGPSTAVWVLTGAGAVGLVAGTVFGFMALSRQSDFDAAPSLSAADEGEAFALVADISFGVALAGGIAAIVLYATEGSGTTTREAAFLLVPTASPQGGGVAATGRF
jgi:tetratricopeptide (TPR) repeat protein